MSSNPMAKRSQMQAVSRAVWAYVAPVNRSNEAITPFDPALQGQFDVNAPPAPFLLLGCVENFKRSSATRYEPLRTGAHGSLTATYRTQPDARAEFDVPQWGKLQMALSSGAQQINVLETAAGSAAQASGGSAVPASRVQDGSTAIELLLMPDQLVNFNSGDIVAVDCDYSGTTGYIGCGASAAYLSAALDPVAHVDLVRRVTLNVSRVEARTGMSLLLTQPLPAAPNSSMGVQKVIAFVDREGSSFFQEWSVLIVVPADSGGRVCFYYPRMQAAASAREQSQEIASPLFTPMLHVSLQALPVTDPNDGESVLCYRSYFPAASAAVY